MKIKESVYKSLTPKQRLISSIDALANQDTDEIKRLQDSCVIKKYSGRDLKYQKLIDGVMDMAVAVELDLRGEVIWYLVAQDEKQKNVHLQNLSNIESSWIIFLHSLDINIVSIRKIAFASGLRNFYVDILMMDLPKPEKKVVEEMVDILKCCV